MDRASARDFLYSFVRDQYRAASLAATGLTGALRYGGIPDEEPANGTYWARVTMRITNEEQETLRSADRTRRFLTQGLVFVQLFCPSPAEPGLVPMDQIAETVRNAFRTYQGAEIEFTTAEIDDNVPAEPNWLRANIVSTFQYRQFL